MLSKNSNIGNASLLVSANVFKELVAQAALECYGISGISSPNGNNLVSIVFPKLFKNKGITIENTERGLKFDICVIAEYGVAISIVCQNFINIIKNNIASFCDVVISDIKIHVKGIHLSR